MPRLTVFIDYGIESGPIVRRTCFLHDLSVKASISACEIVHVSQGCLQLRLIDLSKASKFIIGPSEGVRLIKSRISLEFIRRSYLFIEKLVIGTDSLICIEHASAHRYTHGLGSVVWAPANQPACQPLNYVFTFIGFTSCLFRGTTNNFLRHFIDSDWSCVRLLQVK